MKTSFTATILTQDLGVVVSGLREWLGTEDLEVRNKLSGEQISFEDVRTEVFCYRSASSHGPGPDFLVEGTVPAEDAPAFLSALRVAFARRSVDTDIECDALDDEDDEDDETGGTGGAG